MATAADCARRIETIFGTPRLSETGVVHVTAAWRGDGGPLVTLRIGAATPRSATDSFLLNLARARADAIVTSGRILREEPDLSHALVDEALVVWRREVLGRDEPPVSVVLTSGRDLDLDHPVFRGSSRSLIFTSPAAAEALAARRLRAGVEVMGHAAPSLRAALDFLRGERSLATVAVEVGPTTSRELYRAPLAVDELMLSIYEAPEIPSSVRGPEFLTAAELGRLFPAPALVHRSEEESGPWSFRRLRAGTGSR